MAAQFEFTLNGRSVRVADVSPNTTLLEFLRNSGLTGSKEGCAEGDCGACSVAIIERNSDGKAVYRAVNSCIMPVCLVAGREVVTVEGVCQSAIGNQQSAISNLHPVQRTMAEGYGSQCGYCTPGFICSMFEGYHRDDLHTHADLDEQLAGNLCRCTGYRAIREAAIAAFAERPHRSHGSNVSHSVELAATAYEANGETFLRPTSLSELLATLKANPDARLIAGATELGLEITKRYKKFLTLISTEAVAELKEIKIVECPSDSRSRRRESAQTSSETARTDVHGYESEWHIGAAVTLTEIEDKLGEEFPALGDMLRVFGSRQIRNRATMGGNIVTASPIGDSAPCLLALDAKVVLASTNGERTISINDFFVSYRKTALPESITPVVANGSASALSRSSACTFRPEYR